MMDKLAGSHNRITCEGSRIHQQVRLTLRTTAGSTGSLQAELLTPGQAERLAFQLIVAADAARAAG